MPVLTTRLRIPHATFSDCKQAKPFYMKWWDIERQVELRLRFGVDSADSQQKPRNSSESTSDAIHMVGRTVFGTKLKKADTNWTALYGRLKTRRSGSW